MVAQTNHKITRYAAKIKLNKGDLFTNGENHQGKTPPGEFKTTTPENPLLAKQTVTSKGISVPYTNLQLNSYSNTQLDLFCSGVLSQTTKNKTYTPKNICSSASKDRSHGEYLA